MDSVENKTPLKLLGESSSKKVPETKRVDLDSILDLADELTGRFLGACRLQAGKKVQPGIIGSEKVFDDLIQGFRVVISASQITRNMVVWIEECGKFSIILEKDWVFPGSYQEQVKAISEHLRRMHYGIYIDEYLRPEHLFFCMVHRDHHRMQCLLPEGIEYRFKGNAGAIFTIDGETFPLKRRSVYDIQTTTIEFLQLRDAIIEHAMKMGLVPNKSPDYRGKIELYNYGTFERALKSTQTR